MNSRTSRLPTAVALVVLALAGCGGASHAAKQAPTTTTRAPQTGLRVGLVGDVGFRAAGAYADRGTLGRVADAPLVLVSADAVPVSAVAMAAGDHPASHFALVGASTRALKLGNLVGLLIREDQAAHVAGLLAGLVAKAAGTTSPTVALVGPGEAALLVSFTDGVQAADPRTNVKGYPADQLPASCKEAALAAIANGALAVVGTSGPCVIGVIAAAREQHIVGESLGDFEIFEAAASAIVRQAVDGLYSGREDITFGAQAGAIGVRRLDPLVPAAVAVQARAAAQRYAEGRAPTG